MPRSLLISSFASVRPGLRLRVSEPDVVLHPNCASSESCDNACLEAYRQPTTGSRIYATFSLCGDSVPSCACDRPSASDVRPNFLDPKHNGSWNPQGDPL